jgi:hypothetical protein
MNKYLTSFYISNETQLITSKQITKALIIRYNFCLKFNLRKLINLKFGNFLNAGKLIIKDII